MDDKCFNWVKFINYISPLDVLKKEEYARFLTTKRLSIFNGVNILFLPPAYARNEMEPSIGLIRLASLLHFLGANCEIFPLTAKNKDIFFELLKNTNFNFIGISTTHYTFDNDIELIKEINDLSSHLSIILGGHGSEVSVDIKYKVFEAVRLDCFINGLGEKPLLNYIYSKINNTELCDFTGIDIKGNITGSKANYTDKEYDLLNALQNPQFYPKTIDTLYINTSSHCPMKCVFCSSRNFPGQGVKRIGFNTLENIFYNYFNQITSLKNVSFYDDDLASTFYSQIDKRKYIGKSWVVNLCERIQSNHWKFNYSGLFRIDTIDYKTIDALAKAGFVKLSFGIEHTDKTVLSGMKKNMNHQETLEKIEYISQHGIQVELFFIIFSKWETWESIKKLVVDICHYANRGALIIYNWGLQPLYGSELISMKNKYFKEAENKFVKISKVIPDDDFIGAWFLFLLEHKEYYFSLQGSLESTIYKKLNLDKFKNYSLFGHIHQKNLNSSTTFTNLIRILSMFLLGKKHFPGGSANADWDSIILTLDDAIFKYAYKNFIDKVKSNYDLTTEETVEVKNIINAIYQNEYLNKKMKMEEVI